MTQSIDYSQWRSCGHDDEPRDQQRDLFAGYLAPLLYAAGADMDSDLGTVRVTVTSIEEED
jgi:hypothetical protein